MSQTGIIVLCIAYFSVLVGLAIYAGKKAKNAQEFSSAGRRIGMFVAMCTIVASEWGGGNVMGTASDAYSYGISAYIFPVSMGIGIFLLGLLLAQKYWNIEEVSMCRYIKARYSTRCELLATILMLLSIMLVTGSQFKSGGLLAQSLFGWSPATAIIIFAAIVAAYTCIGGLLGVAYNDTFNLIFGACGLTVCLVAGLLNIGGIPAIMETMTPERLDPRPFGDWVWAVDYLASSTFVMLAVPELIQRIWGCKTGKTARRACTVGGIVYIVLGVMSLGLGLIAYVVLPNIDAGLAMPELVMHLFPSLLGVVIILSVLAALVSTADTMLLICSTMIVEDLIRPFIKKEMSEKQHMLLLRIFIVIVAAITVSFATAFDRVLALVMFSYYVYIGISTVFIFGRIWKGATENAAFWGMIISVVCAAIWQFGDLSYVVSYTTPGIVAIVTSFVPFFGISLIENRMNRKNGVVILSN